MPLIEPGQKAPAFTLKDQHGETHRLSDYAGQHVVLYFYPKDDTPGCTKESCDFQANLSTYKRRKAAVLGVSILDRATNEFHFKPGPIFANIILADEINRTPPRTQTAMLEAMNEATVSIDGRTLPLDPPFMVVATQNPYDFEGTYPLPENQLDRFIMRISVGYPSPDDEARVLAVRPAATALHQLAPLAIHAVKFGGGYVAALDRALRSLGA